METEAHFTGIREVIIQKLSAAKSSVLVAVAWLTDRGLFDALIDCQRRKVSVSLALLDDGNNRRTNIAWERLTAAGGSLYWIPEGTSRAGSLHHKFCLIDNDTVINGSFNWTNRASTADENIVIIQGDPEFAAQFQVAFHKLLDKHGHDAPPIPIDRAKLLSRLAVIAKLLDLEDFEDIAAQVPKLEHAKTLADINEVIVLLRSKSWEDAKRVVQSVIDRGFAVTLFVDPAVVELRLQVRLAEVQVAVLEGELADVQRRIRLFDHEQETAIGDVIRAYLDAKRRYLKLKEAANPSKESEEASANADATYRQYEEARAARAEEEKPSELSETEQQELKMLYRKLAMQCHPDRVTEEDKLRAKDYFQQLQAAYQQNDLGAVYRLKHQMEAGLELLQDDHGQELAEALERRLKELRSVLASVSKSIGVLTNSSTWKTLSTETDWRSWFAGQADRLIKETRKYHDEIEKSELKVPE